MGRSIPLFVFQGVCLTNRELNCSHWIRLNLLLNIIIEVELFIDFYKVSMTILFLFFHLNIVLYERKIEVFVS